MREMVLAKERLKKRKDKARLRAEFKILSKLF